MPPNYYYESIQADREFTEHRLRYLRAKREFQGLSHAGHEPKLMINGVHQPIRQAYLERQIDADFNRTT